MRACNCARASPFQSTHPRGVRPARSSSARVDGQFQSTHPRGVRHEQDFMPSREVVFQSTHPRGVRQDAPGHGLHHHVCFNPRTRVGCDAQVVNSYLRSLGVSIHAPAWGATLCAGQSSLGYGVSIHAPAWGATRPQNRGPAPPGGFNPRTRVGCDTRCLSPDVGRCAFQSTHPRGVRPGPARGGAGYSSVSIHAPAWGATVSMFYPVDSRD